MRAHREPAGEGIGLGEYYILADRNRSTHVREILATFDTERHDPSRSQSCPPR